MRKIIPLIVFMTVFCKNAKAQNPGDYLTNTTLTPFHGTWQWTNGTETLTIFLNTEKTFIAGGQFYSDALMGWHKFERSGVVLVNTFDLRPNHASSSILVGNRDNSQVAEGSYKDVYKNKLGAIKLLQMHLIQIIVVLLFRLISLCKDCDLTEKFELINILSKCFRF
jgi:hypothetical protein